ISPTRAITRHKTYLARRRKMSPEAVNEPIKTLRSLTIAMPQENIDTDQIIPARYLTTTTREGLGKVLFYDWRYDVEGNLKTEAVLNNVDPDGHAILIGGHNFG